MKCVECGSVMERTDEPLSSCFKGVELTVKGVSHWRCEQCGETAFDADDLEAYAKAEDAAYRRREGLLFPEEIKRVRKARQLSQKEFERVLGVASPTVCRWETGAVIQPKPVDNLMRVYDEFDCVAEELLSRAALAC